MSKKISLSVEPVIPENPALKASRNTSHKISYRIQMKNHSSKILPLDISETDANKLSVIEPKANSLIKKPVYTSMYVDSFYSSSLAEIKAMRQTIENQGKRLSRKNVLTPSSHSKTNNFHKPSIFNQSHPSMKKNSVAMKQELLTLNNSRGTIKKTPFLSNKPSNSKSSPFFLASNNPFNNRHLISFNNVYDSLSDDDQEGNERILSQYEEDLYLIDTNSRFYTVWNIIISIAVIYSIIISPLDITIISSDIINYCDSGVDILFIFDIVFNFFTPYVHEEFLIKNRKMIIYNYFTGWFFIDLITAFPFELIIMPIQPVFRVFKFIQKFKWLKILRIGKFASKKDSLRIASEELFRLTPEIKRLLFWLGILAIVLHISSCLWAFLGLSTTDSNNWLNNSGLIDSGPFDIYIASLYFIAATFMTVGYGDIVSYNSTEVVYNIMLLVIGTCIFSFALSILSKIFELLGSASARLEDKMNTLKEISIKYHFKDSLIEKIQKEIRKSKTAKSTDNKYQLFEFLPSNIKQKLIPTVHKQLSAKLLFFNKTTTDFVIFVLPMLKELTCIKNDYIFSIGEKVESMYLVTKGALSLKLGEKFSNFEIGIIPQGNHFGEIQIHFNNETPYDLKAKQPSEILSIKKNDFMRIKENFKEIIFPLLAKSVELMELFETRRGLVQFLFTKNYTIQEIQTLLNKLSFILFQEDFEEYYHHNIPMRELYEYVKKLNETQLLEFISNAKTNQHFVSTKKLQLGSSIMKQQHKYLKSSTVNINKKIKLKETITKYKSLNIVKEMLNLSQQKSANDMPSFAYLKKNSENTVQGNVLEKDCNPMKGTTFNEYCGINKLKENLHRSTITTNEQKLKLISNLRSLNDFQKNKQFNASASLDDYTTGIPHQKEVKEIKKAIHLLDDIISFYKVIARKHNLTYEDEDN